MYFTHEQNLIQKKKKKKMKERMLGKDKLVDVVATICVVARFQCPLITKKIPLKVFT
jgi:hypothetical protein